MPRITCCKCQVDYVIEKNGIEVVDMFLNPPQPYRIIPADRWVCPGCGHKVLAGFPEVGCYHHETRFPKELERVQKMTPDSVLLVYEHPQHPDDEDERMERQKETGRCSECGMPVLECICE